MTAMNKQIHTLGSQNLGNGCTNADGIITTGYQGYLTLQSRIDHGMILS
jgi:hypothetical protein